MTRSCSNGPASYVTRGRSGRSATDDFTSRHKAGPPVVFLRPDGETPGLVQSEPAARAAGPRHPGAGGGGAVRARAEADAGPAAGPPRLAGGVRARLRYRR